MPAAAAAVLIVLVVLVGLGYVAGRTVQIGDLRFSYLAVGTFIAVVVGVLGLVTALDGVVDIAVPQKVASSRGGAGPMMGTLRLPRRLVVGGGDNGGPMQVPVPPGFENMQPRIVIGGSGERSNHAVRDGGIIRLFRGLVLIVGGGAFLYAYRLLMPTLPEAPAPARARPRRREPA
jgi:hypothetical protein